MLFGIKIKIQIRGDPFCEQSQGWRRDRSGERPGAERPDPGWNGREKGNLYRWGEGEGEVPHPR